MNILIAIDSFKGALSSQEAGRAVAQGIAKLGCDTTKVCRVADGGEGSCDALAAYVGGEWRAYDTVDAFHKACKVQVLCFESEGEPCAAIEAAAVFGLHGNTVDRTTVQRTSTYGLGVLMEALRRDGFHHIHIFMGGTITSDGGLGMLQALGVILYDAKGERIDESGNPLLVFDHLDADSLHRVQNIWKDRNVQVGCDVQNPLYGEDGCAYIFAAQKGADTDQIKLIDHQLRVFEEQVQMDLCQKYHGSGGGCAAGLRVVHAHLTSGFKVLNSYLKLEEYLPDMDMVITGEGRMDSSSLQGKLPVAIAKLAKDADVPVIALCGHKSLDTGKLQEYFQGIYSIQQAPCSLQEAVSRTAGCLEETAYQLIRLLHSFEVGSKVEED